MKSIKLPFKLGIYDIETGLLNADIFALGEQRIRHAQLTPMADSYTIICITVKTYGKKNTQTFSDKDSIKQFDAWTKEHDVVLGKNNGKFDDKRCNTERLLSSSAPNMELFDKSDDLEKQLRKYFALPSYSLDYISTLFGFGGKDKMEFSDWVFIKNIKILEKFIKLKRFNSSELSTISEILFKKSFSYIINKGKKALRKMITYNIKDVMDTEKSLTKVLPYIKLKYNGSKDGVGCRICGSTKLIATEISKINNTKYQNFQCIENNEKPHYAGKAVLRYDKSRNKIYGKIK